MFGYISNIENRKKANDIYTESLAPDIIDTGTFCMCSATCLKCKGINLIHSRNTRDSSFIDINDFISPTSTTSTSRTNRIQYPPKRILGDMDILGWEVYTGIDFTLVEYIDLQRHLREAVIGKGKDDWSRINSTKRMALKLDKLLGEQNHLTNQIPMVFNCFDKVLNIILQKIPYLGKNIKYDGRALLGNFGILNEQRPHRDYQQIKK